MSLFYQVLAAFGGGIFGALIGGTNAFIFTGITGLAGVVVTLAGGGDILLNAVAGGPFLAPYVGFAGGAAALAIINRQKNGLVRKYQEQKNMKERAGIEEEINIYNKISGLSVLEPLFPFKNIIAILFGGLIASINHLLNYWFATILVLPIDTVALTIVISGIVVRLTVGNDNIFKLQGANLFKEVNNHIVFNIVWGFPYALTMSYVTFVTENPLIVFYISAFSLILLSFDKSIPATHHISLPAAYATLHFGNIWIGALVGLIGLLLGEYLEVILNKDAESLIDMPSTIIALLSFIIFALF